MSCFIWYANTSSSVVYSSSSIHHRNRNVTYATTWINAPAQSRIHTNGKPHCYPSFSATNSFTKFVSMQVGLLLFSKLFWWLGWQKEGVGRYWLVCIFCGCLGSLLAQEFGQQFWGAPSWGSLRFLGLVGDEVIVWFWGRLNRKDRFLWGWPDGPFFLVDACSLHGITLFRFLEWGPSLGDRSSKRVGVPKKRNFREGFLSWYDEWFLTWAFCRYMHEAHYAEHR